MTDEANKYAYATIGDVARFVYGESSVEKLDVPSETKHDWAISSFIRRFDEACRISEDSTMVFQ